VRRCGFCGGELRWLTGDEESARERAGNAVERDTFECGGRARQYRHVVHELFSGDTHWWGMREKSTDDFADLPRDRWPGF